ncbi:MAG: DUF1553 domain-containing protein [Pirellulales bacterium]
MLLDAPSREICTVKRSRTNTPLQSLALLNEPTYVEAVRKLGERMLALGASTQAERLSHGFRLTTSRTPNERELEVLTKLHEDSLRRFRERPEAAESFLQVGASRSAETLDRVELAAYTMTANILLNLDEALTRE